VVTERLRDCEPVPHDLVQVVQAPKAEASQWIGHGPALQARVSALCGQAAPPSTGSTLVRERLWTPAPHVVLQALQADGKTPGTQSTGQACVLHDAASSRCGQALPPKRGSVFWRARVWLPPLHDLVQVE
jgi:hypothetical protein